MYILIGIAFGLSLLSIGSDAFPFVWPCQLELQRLTQSWGSGVFRGDFLYFLTYVSALGPRALLWVVSSV